MCRRRVIKFGGERPAKGLPLGQSPQFASGVGHSMGCYVYANEDPIADHDSLTGVLLCIALRKPQPAVPQACIDQDRQNCGRRTAPVFMSHS